MQIDGPSRSTKKQLEGRILEYLERSGEARFEDIYMEVFRRGERPRSKRTAQNYLKDLILRKQIIRDSVRREYKLAERRLTDREKEILIKHSLLLFRLPLFETEKTSFYKSLGFRKERVIFEESLDELLNPERRKNSHLWQHIRSGYPSLAKLIEDYAPDNLPELLKRVMQEVPDKSMFGGVFGGSFLPGSGAALKKILETGQRPRLSPIYSKSDPLLQEIQTAFSEVYKSVLVLSLIRGSCVACEAILAKSRPGP